MHRTALAAAAGMLLFAAAGWSQSDQTGGMRQGRHSGGEAMAGADRRFVMEAAQGGMAEVKMGQLALSKASSADVKQFGQRMVDDHTKANNELTSIAQKDGITVPSDIGAKNQSAYDRLSKLSGAEFDRAYIAHMVSDHRKDVSDFQKEAGNGKNDDVKNFASKTLPTLQEHLRMAEDIHSKMGGESADRLKSNSGKR